jgi:cobalt-zinc-cadmium efflux system membrane fusion protein
MKFIRYTVLFLILSLFVVSCADTPANEEENPPVEDTDLIRVDKKQFMAESMELKKIKKHKFSESYKTTGKIITNYLSKALVNPYISGKVYKIHVLLNQNIQKGTLLFSIQSNEFINLQKNYLVAQARLKPAKANYERQKKLFEENISSQKSLLEVEAEYRILLAEYEASTAQLMNMNFSTDDMKSGNVKNYYNIYAPIDGQVQKINTQLGEYVGPENVLLEIVNGEDALLEFVIYADFAKYVNVGQRLEFKSSVSKEDTYDAQIISVGKSMNLDLQGVICQAKILSDESLIPGSKIVLEIYYNVMEKNAVENEAVIKKENKHFVLVKEKEDDKYFYFLKQLVEAGLEDSQFTEIKTPDIQSEILTKGAYYINLDD